MANDGEGSSSTQQAASDKPVIVRVKRKVAQSPLDAFWLEISERPSKRPLLDFGNLSISDSREQVAKELKTKKVFVQHVETATNSEATIDFVQAFVESSPTSLSYSKKKLEGRLHSYRKDKIQEQLLSKARQEQQAAAKDARFEQIWRSRKEKADVIREFCQFYDVVRIDDNEKSQKMSSSEDSLSLEDQRMLASYLPLVREFIPNAAEQIESDVQDYLSTHTEEYVYDYYAVKDEMIIDDGNALHPFPLVKVEEEDFYDEMPDSDYDSEDSNAEDNPRNDYPDEVSEEEEDETENEDDEEEDDEEIQSDDSDESEYPSSCYRSLARVNAKYDDGIYDFYRNGHIIGSSDEEYMKYGDDNDDDFYRDVHSTRNNDDCR